MPISLHAPGLEAAPVRGRASRVAALLLGAALWALPAAGETPGYSESLALAADQEAAGDLAGAARTLEALLPHYPQDYAVHLQLGWLHFRAGNYAAAEVAYQRALALSGGAVAPRLGLAWTALRTRHRDLAVEGFQAVLSRDPGNASAAEGLQLARELRGLRGEPYLVATLHTGSPGATGSAGPWSLGLTLGLPLVIADRFLLQTSYRHIAGVGGRTMGFGPRSGGSTLVSAQHELHGALGLRLPAFELGLHAGHLFAGPEALGPVTVGGLRLRASLAGDLLAESSLSVYPDGRLWRFALGWRSPALGRFRLQPGLALQRTPTALHPSASLSFLYQQGGLRLWLGGKLGDEERPTYLGQPAIFNLEQQIRFGACAGLHHRLEGGWGLGVELELHRLRGDGITTTDGLLTLISFVLARSL